MDREFLNALADKIDLMNEMPLFKDDGLGSLVRLGYLRAVNEIAQWLLEAKLGELKGEGPC